MNNEVNNQNENNTDLTVKQSIDRIEIMNMPDDTVKIGLNRVGFALLHETLDRIDNLSTSRIDELLYMFNTVFKHYIKSNPEGFNQNKDEILRSMNFISEVMLTLGLSIEIIGPLSDAVRMHLSKKSN